MVNYLNNISEVRAAFASGIAAITGEASVLLSGTFVATDLELVNTLFQHAAWTVAIFAGIVSIVNGTKKWFKKNENNKK